VKHKLVNLFFNKLICLCYLNAWDVPSSSRAFLMRINFLVLVKFDYLIRYGKLFDNVSFNEFEKEYTILRFLSRVILCKKPLQILKNFTYDFLGVENISECPSQPWVPIYLIVQGVLALVLLSLILACFISCNDGDKPTCWFNVMIVFISVAAVALVAWQFLGGYWVFGVYEKLQQDGSCNNSCYMLAFVLLVVSVICYGMSLLIGMCVAKDQMCRPP